MSSVRQIALAVGELADVLAEETVYPVRQSRKWAVQGAFESMMELARWVETRLAPKWSPTRA
jgi:hypothetical protein